MSIHIPCPLGVDGSKKGRCIAASPLLFIFQRYVVFLGWVVYFFLVAVSEVVFYQVVKEPTLVAYFAKQFPHVVIYSERHHLLRLLAALGVVLTRLFLLFFHDYLFIGE